MKLFTQTLLLLTACAVSAGPDAGAQVPLPSQLCQATLPWGLTTGEETCPSAVSRNNQTTTPADRAPLPPSWLRGYKCFKRGNATFCAFADPKFNDGVGVAVITTEERLAKIIQQEAFKTASRGSGASQPVIQRKPYIDVPVPGKGLGLVATEPIRDLSLLMSYTPAVMADGRAIDGLSVKEFAELASIGIELLPEQHRNQYLNLSTHDVPANYSMKVYQVFARNAFRTNVGDGGQPLHSVFTEGMIS